VIRKWEVLLGVAGLALFAFVARYIGWSAVAKSIIEGRVAIGVIVGLSVVRLILQTHSWSIALRSDGMSPSISELMVIRLASQGLGYLSVLGPVASEPMKISLLRKSGSATAATLVDTGVYWFISGIVVIVGCLSAVLLMSNGRHSNASFAVVPLIIAASLFFIARPKSRLTPLVDALGARCPRLVRKAAQIEGALRQFERQHPSAIRKMLILDIACQVLLAAEVVAMFWSLRIPFHLSTVLGVEGATRAIKIIGGWMPARIGADESGMAGAFLAFGMSPASGLTLALARRSRDMLFAFIGLSWLALSTRFWKIAISKQEKTTCRVC
jgi:hypothetical protein